jgi:tricorn protease-like protein
VIYVGTDDGKIWVSSDNGVTWKEITNTSVERWVTRVVPDNNDENIIYATYSGLKWRDPDSRVFKSTNMGEDWIDISYNLPDAPVNSFAIDPSSPNTLYAGLDVGVFVLKGNESWEAYGTGLPIVTVYDMKVHPTTKKLIIGTHGRSMYGIDTDGTVAVNEESNIPGHFVLEQNYPNPFNPTTSIEYSVVSNEYVSLKVYDLLGNEIADLVNEKKEAGKYNVTFDASEFASGVYIYRLTSGSINLSKKMILIK